MLTPGRERFGMNAGAHGFALQKEIFAEAQALGEIANGGLAFECFRDGRGGEQPCGKSCFSCAGACCGEKLKERCVAKDVEIARIGVKGVEEAFPRFSAAGPAIFEARDAAVVELDGAGAAAHGTDHLFVGDGERDVDGDGDGEELDGCGMAQEPEGEE